MSMRKFIIGFNVQDSN